jgi:hypothetical protein
MNKTKLRVVYDNVLPKGTIIKKKQVILDGTLTHLSKERKNSEFLKENELSCDNCVRKQFLNLI